MRMLYSHRLAYARMGRFHRAVHRALWAVYWPTLSRTAIGRRLWGAYRRRWS
jgi:hypothetical protein